MSKAAPQSAGQCLLCGGTEHRPLPDATAAVRATAAPGHVIARCRGCGLAALRPLLSAEEKAAVYAGGYYDAYAERVGVAGGSAEVAPHLAARLAQVEARAGKGRLLDIGCAEGLLLAHAEQRGWEADGIEASEAALAAQDRLERGRVFHGPVEEAAFAPGAYAMVHMNHVLEHLDDPIAALRRVHDWLRPGGAAVIEVPNEIGTLFYWIGRALFSMEKRRPPTESGHEYFFTPRTLRAVAEKAGLRVQRIRTLRRAFGLQDRFPPVRWAKRLVYLLEKPLGMAGMIEMWAERPR